jgi:hypothetical protein
MSEAIPQAKPERFANLDALYKQLEEMAVRTKEPDRERKRTS